MTTYYAAVKYAVDDTKDVKAKALSEGLQTIAMSLIEEFGWTFYEVQEALDNATSAAEWSDSAMESLRGESPEG